MTAYFVRKAIEAEAPLLAASLMRYAEAEGLTWKGLADRLHCTEAALDAVALCRPPRQEQFVTDVEAIAAGYTDADSLLAILRQIDALEAFRGSGRAAENAWSVGRTLMAAMDREETGPNSRDTREKADTSPEDQK